MKHKFFRKVYLYPFYEAQIFQESLFIPFQMYKLHCCIYITWTKICLLQLRLNYNPSTPPSPLSQQQTQTEGINIFYLF